MTTDQTPRGCTDPCVACITDEAHYVPAPPEADEELSTSLCQRVDPHEPHVFTVYSRPFQCPGIVSARTETTDHPCLNPLPHGPHEWLADSDAVTMSPCPGHAATVPTAGGDLRDRIRRAICEASGFTWLPDELREPDEYGDVADAVLAVLRRATQPEIKAAVLPAPADSDLARALREILGRFADWHAGSLVCHVDGETWDRWKAALDTAPPAPTEFELRSTTDARAAVLAEAIEVARQESERLAAEMSGDAAYGARAVAKLLRRMADEAQQAEPAGPFGEQEPVQLRWGLNDVMWGDDDTVTVMLSGPAREPYWLELAPERRDALREALVAPEGDEQQEGEGR